MPPGTTCIGNVVPLVLLFILFKHSCLVLCLFSIRVQCGKEDHTRARKGNGGYPTLHCSSGRHLWARCPPKWTGYALRHLLDYCFSLLTTGPHCFFGYRSLLSVCGLASKFFVDTGAGVIDADYRGTLFVLLFNHSDEDFEGM